MNLILFEDQLEPAFRPLTFTRPVGELRMGALSNSERWSLVMGHPVFHQTRAYLERLFVPLESGSTGYLINARLLPTKPVVDQIKALSAGESLRDGQTLLALRFDRAPGDSPAARTNQVNVQPLVIEQITDLFAKNGAVIQLDFDLLTNGRTSENPGESVVIIGPRDRLFIEPGAQINGCIINVNKGPVYIAGNAEIMEGSMIRGPFALGPQAVVKMGAKIYGPTSAGPHCRVGGEISNSVIQGYSNKGHDGFLGNSVLGEWCNLGADTNTSNLKNNYATVKTWNYVHSEMRDTGQTFVGLVMGDHSKSGINTMFNTGTVAGVAANVFGGGFPPKFIPSFSWGGPQGMVAYRLEEALLTAERMMARRHVALTDEMRIMLTEVFRMTSGERSIASIRQD